MSGGQLVVLDHSGRTVKRYPLAHGLVKLGRDESSDIRIMLDSVDPHHATVVLHANQAVVRAVGAGATLVNGTAVSVAALRHGDVLTIGGRALRWEYAQPTTRRALPVLPAVNVPVTARKKRTRARASCPGGVGAPGVGGASRRDRAIEYALEMRHRASMPANAGGKQVAIVQPQRRDTHELNDKPTPRTPVQCNKRPRMSRNDLDVSVSDADADKAKRKSTLQNPTKATLWIESRKSSPRNSNKIQSPPKAARTPVRSSTSAKRNPASARKITPLRLTVLRRAQSAQAGKVTKIEAPSKIDHTKQAALLLITGHTSKSRLFNSLSPNKSKSDIDQTASVKSSSPRVVSSKGSLVVKKTTRIGRAVSASPKYRPVSKSQGRRSLRKLSNRSCHKSIEKSPLLPNPKKSALKNPLLKKSMRKTESIKFDLSNLEGYSQDSDVLLLSDTTQQTAPTASENDFTLRYSTSGVQSPSPRRPIHSRTSKMLEKTLGSTITLSPPSSKNTKSELPRSRKSSRGSLILQNALNTFDETVSYSTRTTKSLSDVSDVTVASGFRTRTLSPKTQQNNLESYSIVDLVSVDSNESGHSSVYNSAGSTSSAAFATPQNSVGRKTRSTINPTLLGSSTPYVKVTRMSNTSSNVTVTSNGNDRRSSRRSKSVSTPENRTDISINSTRISRASRRKSRLKDSDLLLVETDDADESPRSSRRVSTTSKRSSSAFELRNISAVNMTCTERVMQENGVTTPENSHSPQEASTPVLSIQNLLDSSRSSTNSMSLIKGNRPSLKRKTIGVLSGMDKIRVSPKSKSMIINPRLVRSRLSDDSYENLNVSSQKDDEVVTPKSAVKLVPEAVKNKHSTAKKPQSKRSIIDDLNESDVVKQLFNSPVKRKLSQSMIEFSRKQLFEDNVAQVRRPTRSTIAMTGVSLDNSLIEHSEAFSPERFVSPISTPSNSPNLYGIKMMFGKNTPENDLRDVRGVKALLRTPSARKSIKNDLTNVSGVKRIYSKNFKNSLSDVRVKEIFATSPNNDLRRVSGVKSLFQPQRARKSPRNSLGDVRGVKMLFNRRSPNNELRNLSGVKRTFRKSPKNDLSDVRGLKHLFARNKNELDDLSGVEELFNADESFQKTPEKSKNNPHSRELQNLATDTVAGTSPLRTSRARNSTIIRTSVVEVPELPKSASELYSSRKLPIKKRSFVNASVEHSKNNSKTNYLPIKKRAFDLLHSTPVKGRQINMTMNASELGRVSPIVPDHTLREENDKNMSNIPGTMNIIKTSPKNTIRDSKRDKSTRTYKSTSLRNVTKRVSPIKQNSAMLSPKPTSSRQRKETEITALVETSVPKVTRVMRNKDKAIEKPKTPKNNRTKVQKATVVVMKTSPQIKPRATRGRGQESRNVSSGESSVKPIKRVSLVVVKKTLVTRPQIKRTRESKQLEDSTASKVTSIRKTRANRSKNQKVVKKQNTPRIKKVKLQETAVLESKPPPQIKPRTTRSKTEKNQSEMTTISQKVVKGTKVFASVESPAQSSLEQDIPKRRGRKTNKNNDSKQNGNDSEHNQTKSKRGRMQTDKQESMKQNTRSKSGARMRQVNKEVVTSKSKTTRAIKQKSVEEAPQTANSKAKKLEVKVNMTTGKTGRRRSPDSTQTELPTRSRRTIKTNNTIIPETNARKRKSVATDNRPTKVSKKVESGGRNKKVEAPKTVASSKKPVNKGNKVVEQGAGDTSNKLTKSRIADVSMEAQKDIPRTTRGRKAAIVVEPTLRKRKNQVDIVEEKSKKKARGGKSPGQTSDSPKPRRTTRAAAAEVSKPVSRSRRR